MITESHVLWHLVLWLTTVVAITTLLPHRIASGLIYIGWCLQTPLDIQALFWTSLGLFSLVILPWYLPSKQPRKPKELSMISSFYLLVGMFACELWFILPIGYPATIL